jgi:hypothetical protein
MKFDLTTTTEKVDKQKKTTSQAMAKIEELFF